MLCVLELAMTVMGIMALVKGKLQLTKNRVVTGVPAIFAGLVLTSTLPVLLALGFAIGVALGATNPNRPVTIMEYPALILVDLGGIALIGLIAVGIMMAFGRDPAQDQAPQWANPVGNSPFPPLPPQDPSNPYSPPHS